MPPAPAAPPQQQARQQPPPRPAPPVPPPQALAAMALPLAGLLLTAVSAAAVVAALKLSFKLHALWWLALLMVLSATVMAHPPAATGFAGPAGAAVARLNLARRAQYAIAAASRVMTAMLAARARGASAPEAGREAVERERRFYQMHLDAMRQRAAAAMAIDMMAAEHGPLLGWQAVLGDGRTTPECRRASGRNFYVDNPPAIGLPGVVHVGCRCKAVPPWPGGKLLPGSGPRYARAA